MDGLLIDRLFLVLADRAPTRDRLNDVHDEFLALRKR